jgi:6-phosphogluconolactonase (cycloisomerase 2 family)
MTSLARLTLAAALFALAACASPNGAAPTAPAPVPTPRPRSSPALVVVTAARSRAVKPTPAHLSVYAIGADGRLTLAASPQPVGALDRVYAASYSAASGLYRQAVSEVPFSLGGAVTLVTYALDAGTGVFTRLGASDLPRRSTVIAFHPSGRFLYAGAGAQQIDGYELDPQNGALLRALPGAPFSWEAPMGVVDLRFTASGRFAWGHGRIPDGYHSNRGFVVSFAVDPGTGALQTSDETPMYDQQSILAVSTREDAAYLVDRTVLRPGAMTWRRFSVDRAGVLDQEEQWDGRHAAGLHFSASDRFLLSIGDGDRLALLERGPDDRPVQRTQIEIPKDAGSDHQRALFQVGDFLYLGGDRTLGVVRLDEPAQALSLVQEVTPGEDLEILSVALVLPPPS